LKEKKSLFRNFVIKPPFQSIRDIFCIRIERIVNPYRKISINKLELKADHVPVGTKVGLRIYPNERTVLAEIRIWHNNKLMGIQRAKIKDLNIVHF